MVSESDVERAQAAQAERLYSGWGARQACDALVRGVEVIELVEHPARNRADEGERGGGAANQRRGAARENRAKVGARRGGGGGGGGGGGWAALVGEDSQGTA